MFLRLFLFIVIFFSEAYAELGSIVKKASIDNIVDIKSKDNKLTFVWQKEVFSNLTKIDEKWWLIFNAKALEVNLPRDRDLPKGIVSIDPIFDTCASDNITVFEIGIDGPFDLVIGKEDGNWTLETINTIEEKFESSKLLNIDKSHKKNIIHNLHLSIKKWPSYELENLKDFQMISIIKNDTRREYSFVLTKDLDGGINTVFETPYFTILETGQGFSVQNLCDSVFFLTNKKSIDLVVPHAPDAISIRKISEIKTKKEDFQISFFKELSNKDLNEAIETIKQNFSNEKNTPLEHLLQSWVYLLLGDQTQSMAFINLMLSYYPALEHHPFIRMLKASAYLLDKSYTKANEYMFFLPNTLEVQFLRSVILASEDIPKKQTNKLKKIKLIYKNYNTDLKDELLSQVVLACLNCGEYELLSDIIDQNKKSEETHMYLLYKFAKLVVDKKLKKEKITSDKFKELLKEKPWDIISPQIKAYILFEISNLEFEEEKIKKEEYIKKLNDLQFLWRGDIFELKLLQKTGEYYYQQHDYINALSTFEKINKIFKKSFKILHFDKKMEECFLNFFKEKLYLKKSPLKIVGLFEMYQDYIPETEDGKIIGQIVADTLIDMNLLDNAAELLMKWTMHEKEDEIKAASLIKIASIHIDDKNGDAALSALDKIPENQKNNLSKEIDTLKVSALILINKKQEAINLLEQKNTSENIVKIIDILLLDNQLAKAHQKLTDKLMGLNIEKNDPVKMECLILIAKINVQLGDFSENEALQIMHEDFVKQQPKEKRDTFNYLVDDPQIPGTITRKIIDDQLDSTTKIKELKDAIYTKNSQ